MDISSTLNIEQKTLEKLRYAVARKLSPELMEHAQVFVEVAGHMGQDIQMRLEVRVPAEEIVSYKTESGWWQATKARLFPRWLLKRFPVKYDTFKLYFLHPDIKLPEHQERMYYALVPQFHLERHGT